ncbi:hypothetical protein BOX15_Mlig015446g6, partial [Macrostomum lignano]
RLLMNDKRSSGKRKLSDAALVSSSSSSSSTSPAEPAEPAIKTSKPAMTAATAASKGPVQFGWQNGLKSAMQADRQALFSDDVCVIIADKYPKARHHYLVLPKRQIDSLAQLQRSDASMLKRMLAAAESFIAEKNLLPKSFRFGFHAVPSMSQLHMHVVSQDFVSTCLKTKKHWLSFTTDFFLDCSLLLQLLESADSSQVASTVEEPRQHPQQHLISSGRLGIRGSGPSASLAIDRAWFSSLTKAGELKCNQCARVAKNMPDLKAHLAGHERT